MFEDEYNLKSLQKIDLGKFQMYITPRYFYHYVQNKYEQFSSEIILNYVVDKTVFVDVGAHFGYYSMLASASKTGIKVIAFEPVKTTFQILTKNMKLNKVDCKLYNLAASNIAETKTLNITEASDSVGFYQHPMTKTKEEYEVKCISLDNILSRKKIGFMKIDVEGHEISVLEGLQKTLDFNPDLKILIEFCPQLQTNAGHSPEELLEYLNKIGYELFLIDEDKRMYYRLTDNLYTWSELMGKNTYANIFCIPKKSALLITYFSHTDKLGGAERSMVDLIDQMKPLNGLSNVILPSLEGSLVKRLQNSAVSYNAISYNWWTEHPNLDNKKLYGNSLRDCLTFLPTLKMINPHLILTNSLVLPWGGLLAKLLNVPHIWIVSEYGQMDHGFTFFAPFKEILQIINLLSDKVYFVSHALGETIKPFLSRGKGEVLYQNITVKQELINENIKGTFKSPKALKVIVLGFVSESKGQDQIVQAVCELAREGEQIELLVLGKIDNENDYCQRLISLDKEYSHVIHLKNFVENPYPYIKQADIVVICSRCEAFGRTAIEAMILSKPVIMANRGSYRELIKEDYNGFCYKYGDIQDLKSKLKKFILNHKLIKKLGINGNKFVKKNFSPSNYAKKVYDCGIKLKSTQPKELNSTRKYLAELLNPDIFIFRFSETISNNTELIQKIFDSKFYKLWCLYQKVKTRILDLNNYIKNCVIN